MSLLTGSLGSIVVVPSKDRRKHSSIRSKDGASYRIMQVIAGVVYATWLLFVTCFDLLSAVTKILLRCIKIGIFIEKLSLMT